MFNNVSNITISGQTFNHVSGQTFYNGRPTSSYHSTRSTSGNQHRAHTTPLGRESTQSTSSSPPPHTQTPEGAQSFDHMSNFTITNGIFNCVSGQTFYNGHPTSSYHSTRSHTPGNQRRAHTTSLGREFTQFSSSSPPPQTQTPGGASFPRNFNNVSNVTISGGIFNHVSDGTQYNGRPTSSYHSTRRRNQRRAQTTPLGGESTQFTSSSRPPQTETPEGASFPRNYERRTMSGNYRTRTVSTAEEFAEAVAGTGLFRGSLSGLRVTPGSRITVTTGTGDQINSYYRVTNVRSGETTNMDIYSDSEEELEEELDESGNAEQEDTRDHPVGGQAFVIQSAQSSRSTFTLL